MSRFSSRGFMVFLTTYWCQATKSNAIVQLLKLHTLRTTYYPISAGVCALLTACLTKGTGGKNNKHLHIR